MRLQTNTDIYVFAALVTAGACSVVAVVIMLLYPRDEWAWELTLSLTLTTTITMTITTHIAKKMRMINALSDELQRLLARDRLTDVATRDYFYDLLETSPEAFGVSLMVDIDHFKRVNDTHGHLAGDAVIQRVARVLQKRVGDADIVCRFGGEEFVIFLRDRTVAEAQEMAENLRQAIAQDAVCFEGLVIAVTVSIGGSLRARCADIDEMIKQADAALYRAKALGRDRVAFHGERDADVPSMKAAS